MVKLTDKINIKRMTGINTPSTDPSPASVEKEQFVNDTGDGATGAALKVGEKETAKDIMEPSHELSDEEVAGGTAIIGDSIGKGFSSLGMKEISKRHRSFSITSAPLTGSNISVEKQLDTVDPKKFPFLVIQGGTNELDSINDRKSAEKIAQKQIDIALKASERGFKKIMIVTIPPHKDGTSWGIKSLAYNNALKDLAKKSGVKAAGIELYDLRAGIEALPDYKQSDYLEDGDDVHPSKHGAQLASRLIVMALKNKDGKYTNEKIWENAYSFVPGLQADFEEVDKENPAGTLNKSYLEKLAKMKDKKEGLEKEFQKMSVEDIRFGKFFEENKKIADADKRIENIKDETLKRITAYTDFDPLKEGEDYKNKWLTLNYQRVGGAEHEREIGLGDILLDASIKNLLVVRDGQVIKATRKKVEQGTHAGRQGFVDENGYYVATFTGDKFKILSDEEAFDTQEKKDNYLKEFDSESTVREENKTTYQKEQTEMGALDVEALLNGTDTESELAKIKIDDSKSVISQMRMPLNSRQIQMASLIESEFIKAGLSRSVAAAAIVNAYAESNLNPSADANPRGENSVGLFQLNARGAGQGMSIEQRRDPLTNIRTILQREVLTARGSALTQAAKSGMPVSALASIFSRDIERPGDTAGEMRNRANLARRFFPAEKVSTATA